MNSSDMIPTNTILGMIMRRIEMVIIILLAPYAVQLIKWLWGIMFH